jgi:hypothetical protein
MSKKKVAIEAVENESTSSQVLREILTGSPVRTILSIFVGFAVGAIFMVVFNPEVLKSFGYFFGRPGDTFAAMGKTIGDGYGALFRGAIFNTQADDFAIAIRPITETLRFAAPLILAGLGADATHVELAAGNPDHARRPRFFRPLRGVWAGLSLHCGRTRTRRETLGIGLADWRQRQEGDPCCGGAGEKRPGHF